MTCDKQLDLFFFKSKTVFFKLCLADGCVVWWVGAGWSMALPWQASARTAARKDGGWRMEPGPGALPMRYALGSLILRSIMCLKLRFKCVMHFCLVAKRKTYCF